VRRFGQSYAHPLLVLVLEKRGAGNTRFAVTAGNSIGNSIQRNRAKRLIRSALRDFLNEVKPGYNGILIARKPLVSSTYWDTKSALQSLLIEAGLIDSGTDG
jgi:ribonuclease P protein component